MSHVFKLLCCFFNTNSSFRIFTFSAESASSLTEQRSQSSSIIWDPRDPQCQDNFRLKNIFEKGSLLYLVCSAKSTELLHSPPVYESDIDTLDHDFYDYALPDAAVSDDDFYYVSWEDPIYDVFQEYDYNGKHFYWKPCSLYLSSHKSLLPLLRSQR